MMNRNSISSNIEALDQCPQMLIEFNFKDQDFDEHVYGCFKKNDLQEKNCREAFQNELDYMSNYGLSDDESFYFNHNQFGQRNENENKILPEFDFMNKSIRFDQSSINLNDSKNLKKNQETIGDQKQRSSNNESEKIKGNKLQFSLLNKIKESFLESNSEEHSDESLGRSSGRIKEEHLDSKAIQEQEYLQNIKKGPIIQETGSKFPKYDVNSHSRALNNMSTLDCDEGENCKKIIGNCSKSKGIKMYGAGFRIGLSGSSACSCINGLNSPEHKEKVWKVRDRKIFIKNRPFIGTNPEEDYFGNCKMSFCEKSYCPGSKNSQGCSDNCRGFNCKNVFGRKEITGY